MYIAFEFSLRWCAILPHVNAMVDVNYDPGNEFYRCLYIGEVLN